MSEPEGVAVAEFVPDADLTSVILFVSESLAVAESSADKDTVVPVLDGVFGAFLVPEAEGEREVDCDKVAE